MAFLCVALIIPQDVAYANNPEMNVDRTNPGASPTDIGFVRSPRAICRSSSFTSFGSIRASFQNEPFAFDLYEQNGIDRERLQVIGHRFTLRPTYGMSFGKRGVELAFRTALIVQSGRAKKELSFSTPKDVSLGDIELLTKYSFLQKQHFSAALGLDVVTGAIAAPGAMSSDGPLSARLHFLMEPAIPKAGAKQPWARFPIQLSYNAKTEAPHPALKRISDFSVGLGAVFPIWKLISVRAESMMLFPANGNAFNQEGSGHRGWYAGFGMAFGQNHDYSGWSGGFTGAGSLNFPSGDPNSSLGQVSGRGNFIGPFGAPSGIFDGVVNYSGCCPDPIITGISGAHNDKIPEGGAVITGKSLNGKNLKVYGQDNSKRWHELTIRRSSENEVAITLPTGEFTWRTARQSAGSTTAAVNIPIRLKTDCGEDKGRAIVQLESQATVRETCAGWNITFNSAPRCAVGKPLSVVFTNADKTSVIGVVTVPFSARLHVAAPSNMQAPAQMTLSVAKCMSLRTPLLEIPSCVAVKQAVDQADQQSKGYPSECKSPSLTKYQCKHPDCAGLPSPLVKRPCAQSTRTRKTPPGPAPCASPSKAGIQIGTTENGEGISSIHRCIYLRRCQICASKRTNFWGLFLVTNLKSLREPVRRLVSFEIQGHSSSRWRDRKDAYRAPAMNKCLSRIRLEVGAKPLFETLRKAGYTVKEASISAKIAPVKGEERRSALRRSRRIEILVRVAPPQTPPVKALPTSRQNGHNQ